MFRTGYRFIPLSSIQLCCILLIALCTGCVRNEFSVEVNLPKTINSSYQIVYYARDKRGGITQETAITVAKGHGEIKGITRLPVCAFIYEGSSTVPAAVFYARRGDKITITGETETPYKWVIKGNPITDQLTQWRLDNAAILSLNNRDKINIAVEKYVRDNPESELSPLLIACYYDRRVNTGKEGDGTGLDKLVGMLRGKAADEELIALTGRVDIPLPAEASRKVSLPAELILQTSGTGADTIRLRKGKPTLLVFRSYNNDGDNALMDTLKSVSRHYRDSLRRNIVELYLAADSLNWRTAMRPDSLRGVVRARLPREYAEPLSVGVRLKSTPRLIVTDGRGQIRYDGTDPAAASKSFRRLLKK
ncbi:MAG: hypothetical protein K2M03_08100 [Muribaculaceae bacterium]|nr:hypothetical protein [Muribaculaceae bacterium]